MSTLRERYGTDLMKRFIPALALIIFFSTNLASASSKDTEFSARVVGFKFADVPFATDWRMSVLSTSKPSGVVNILAKSKNKIFIKFDKIATNKSIQTWQIDRDGNKLTVKPKLVKIEFSPKLNKSAKASLFKIKYDFYPKENTKKVRTKLNIFYKVADAKTEVLINKYSFSSKRELKIGSFKLKFKTANKKEAKHALRGIKNISKNPYVLTLDFKGDVDQLAELKFYTLDGQKIIAYRKNISTTIAGVVTKITPMYVFLEKINQVKIKAKYWISFEAIKIPITFNIHTHL